MTSSVYEPPEHIQVPDLSLPFQSPQHPDASDIEEATIAWMLDCGLIADERHERYARQTRLGYWYPTVAPEGETETVLLGSSLTCFYTMIDDHLAEGEGSRQGRIAAVTRQLVRCEEITRLPRDATPQNALEHAQLDLIQRLARVATAEQMIRLQWHALQYFLGIIAEAAHSSECVTPTVADYQRVRHLTSCIRPFLVMGEIVAGVSIPPETLMQPEVQRLTALAVNLTTVVNDIVGLPRDLQRHDTWTYAHVLTHHESHTQQYAMNQMSKIFHHDAQEFSRLADSLGKQDDRHLNTYIRVLHHMVAGHLQWTRTSPRYSIGGYH